MDDMQFTVENPSMENVPVDAALALAEHTEAPETPISTLEELVNEPAPETPAAETAPPAKEPGWIRGRINTEVRKAVAETEKRMQAQFQATLAPLYESMMEREADALVRSGEVKSKDTALELVRLRHNQPAAAQPGTPQQPSGPARDAQGRFVAQQAAPQSATPQQPAELQPDSVAKARASILAGQAEKIKAAQGLDVMQAFNSTPEYRQKVLSGEWDFHDVATAMRSPRRSPPSPMRAPNGAQPTGLDISSMSDAQFERLQESLASGKLYR